MHIFADYRGLPEEARGASVALGNFDGLHVGQAGHVVDLGFAVAGYDAAGHARVQRWHLEFVTNRAVDAVSEVEFVRVDGLGRAIERIDALRHLGDGGVDRMDERTLADPLVRVRDVGAEQQAGAADGAGGDHEVSGFERDLDPGRGDTIIRKGRGFQVVDLVLVHYQAVGAQAVEQPGVVIERPRNGGHQGALFGVGRAADAAIAQVPAAFHIAGNDLPAVTQFFAALAQDVVVDVRVDLPDRKSVV